MVRKIHLLTGLNRCACTDVLPYSSAFTIDPHSVTCLRCLLTKAHQSALLKRNSEIRRKRGRMTVQPELFGE